MRRGQRRPHSEIAAVPAERLAEERRLLGVLPSLRLRIARAGVPQGRPAVLRAVRLGPLLGADLRDRHQVEILTDDGRVPILTPVTGEILAEHRLVAPGEASVRR